MNTSVKSLLKAFASFITLFLAGYVVIFSFQNCGRAQFGMQDGLSGKATGQTVVPQDTAVSCPSGQVAIGITSSGGLVCLTPRTTNGLLCSPNEYIHSIDAGNAVCLAVADRPAGGTLCGYNQYLASTVDLQSLTCVNSPAAPVLCPPDQWLIGYDSSNSAVCSGASNPTPTPTPNPGTPTPTPGPGTPINVTCPAGHYLESIVNAMPVCKKILPDVNPTAACPSGYALVGQTGATASCQALMSIPTDDQLCVNGYIKNTGNAVECAPLPDRDYAHYCGDGKYVKAITTQGFLCENLPSNLVRYNGTCMPGYYLQGFENQMPKCMPVTTTPNYTHFCPRGFYAAEIINNVIICRSHQPGALLCAPGSQRTCQFPNGMGSQTCTPDGKSWGSCLPTACNPGYELNGMKCEVTSCPDGYTKMNGQCVDKTAPKVEFTQVPPTITDVMVATFKFNVIETGSGIDTIECRLNGGAYAACTNMAEYQLPALGLHTFELIAKDKAGNSTKVTYAWTAIARPPVCIPGTSYLCLAGNAAGTQLCKADGSGFEACIPLVCPVGFEMKNGCCIPKNCPQCQPTCTPGAKFQCQVTNGTGETTCRSDGKGYSECVPKTCNSGYELKNGQCVKKPDPVFQKSWVNANSAETHASACARVGGTPVTGTGINGLGICAATESRPGNGSGEGWNSIVYVHGIKNRHGVTYAQVRGGVTITKSGSKYYCYKAGQKKDNDKTDLVVAYLCNKPM